MRLIRGVVVGLAIVSPFWLAVAWLVDTLTARL
jgi:hypothetical protein